MSPVSSTAAGSPGSTDADYRRWSLAAWLVAILALLVNEGRLILAGPVLDRDDHALLDPLRHLHALGDYVSLLRHHAVLDLQPVRDLSLWLDLRLSAALGHPTFHATNLLLLLALLALAQRLWVGRVGRTRSVAVALLLLAVHPSVANTVSWISARKHLLSAVFILAATLLLERDERPRHLALAGLAFALSVLSQPITVLWPLWLGFDRSLRQGLRAGLVRAAPFLLVALPVAALNVAYYQGAYVDTGGAKFVGGLGTATVSLLSLGRYLFNCLCPIAVSVEYEPGRLFNLIGLVALPLAVALSVKRLGLARALPAWALFAFPLLTVTVRMTNIFVSDTYLLVPLVGVGWLLAAGLSSFEPRALPLGVAAGGAALALAMSSHAVANSWSSNEALWDHAYRTEPTPSVLAKQAYFVANAHRYAEARQLAMRLLEWKPEHSEAAQVYTRAVFLDPALSPARKYEAIAACPVQDAWTRYFRASRDAHAGDFVRAWAELAPDADDARRLGTDVSVIAAEAQFLCQRAQGTGCATLPERFRKSGPSGWSAEKFAARARQLGLSPATPL
jgi:hypothetical protein